ncbi:hypothetical protein MMC20_007819 [Loxospora ochrophaea]|nr:hypothetical protein [Loxospora ochrophaea]
MASMTADIEVPSLIRQLKTLKLGDIKDEATRKSLLEAPQDAAVALETPKESIQRIATCLLSNVQHTFTIEPAPPDIVTPTRYDSVFTTTELVEKSKADQVLLGRLLRYLSSVRMVNEVGEDQWAANDVTKTLSVPGFKAGIYLK